MDIGIAEVRKSEKKTLGGGARATLKVYKLTPVGENIMSIFSRNRLFFILLFVDM